MSSILIFYTNPDVKGIQLEAIINVIDASMFLI